MNEYKSRPVALWFGVGISTIFIGLMVAAFAKGPELGWTGYQLLAIELGLLSTCLLLLLFVRFFEAVLLRIASMKADRWTLLYDKNKAAQGGATQSAESREHARVQGQALRDALRTLHGWRWRDRQPWLLLTGNDNMIGRLLPEIAESGWQITPDAVLLWGKSSAGGQLDAGWLRQIYQLRRRRPVDAVLLVIDGATGLTADRSGFHEGSQLTRISDILRWSAPVYALDVAQSDQVSSSDTPVIACEVARQADTPGIGAQLLTLRNHLAQHSLARLPQQGREQYLGQLSRQLETRSEALAAWLARLIAGQRRRATIRGILFAPWHGQSNAASAADLPLWHYVAEAVKRVSGRRTVWHPITILTALVLTSVALWSAGMLVSGVLNQRDIHAARQAAHDIRAAPNAAARLKALLALQQQIERYEYRTQHHAPLLTRFGLNRDAEVLAALWKPYAQASRDLLVTPVQQDVEASLVDLAQMRTADLNEQTARWALAGHGALKAYLMLANPEKADAAFLAPQLAQHWTTEARVSPGEKQDLAERLFRFYATHLKARPDWRIEPRPELVAGARQTLLAVIGERNAQDTVFQGILDGAGSKYPGQTLASLTAGTDPRGLLRASAIVPGVFTRQAYEGYVAAAIEEAARRKQVDNDWVLTGGRPQQPAPDEGSGRDLQFALTEQYFTEYAEHWQQFMNSMQWEPAPTLPAVIDQFKLLADARQSPVIALMKSLEYQGGAGARKDSLSDTLVNKAKDLLGKKSDAPEVAKADPAGPLGAAFGPVLRLVGHQAGQGTQGGGELSLQRYLDRATALRLRLQQIGNSADADAQARQMAQALFQGKGSELADTQSYAQLMAASLGAEWAGMGETLFVRPIALAMQTVMAPAQASLNDDWQRGIAMEWNRSFAGRYPFADTANDASLAELARFLRPQGGLINAFLGSQLAGVLERKGDQWVPVASSAQALSLDAGFLKVINTLQRIGVHLLAQGDPMYRFQLKPIPTPGLTDTLLTVDNQKLHYFNQRESWQSMTWPANNLQEPRTLLQWQTEKAGTSKNYEFDGRWGWVRMLERAHVVPLDSATFQLTWQSASDTAAPRAGLTENEPEARQPSRSGNPDSLTAREASVPAPADMSYPIRYQLRTEVGQGPLEMLALRDLKMPERIFVVDRGSLPTAPR